VVETQPVGRGRPRLRQREAAIEVSGARRVTQDDVDGPALGTVPGDATWIVLEAGLAQAPAGLTQIGSGLMSPRPNP